MIRLAIDSSGALSSLRLSTVAVSDHEANATATATATATGTATGTASGSASASGSGSTSGGGWDWGGGPRTPPLLQLVYVTYNELETWDTKANLSCSEPGCANPTDAVWRPRLAALWHNATIEGPTAAAAAAAAAAASGSGNGSGDGSSERQRQRQRRRQRRRQRGRRQGGDKECI